MKTEPADELTLKPRLGTPPWVRALLYGPIATNAPGAARSRPAFFIRSCTAALGIGLGSLVNHHAHTVDHVSYLDFLAPGLLAATAMQIGGNEATYPVMGSIKWDKTYYAMFFFLSLM